MSKILVKKITLTFAMIALIIGLSIRIMPCLKKIITINAKDIRKINGCSVLAS